MLINQKYYDKTIASIKEAFYPLWASYQLVSGCLLYTSDAADEL